MTKETFAKWRDYIEDQEAETAISKAEDQARRLNGDLNEVFFDGEVIK